MFFHKLKPVSRILIILALGVLAVLPVAEAEESHDVTGMSAVYNAETGGIRFEGLSNIHGIGIMKWGDVGFNPLAATQTGSFSVANDEEISWLFLEGSIEGGGFDAGAIFSPGLNDQLSNYYIGVVSIGSGKKVTPIPIVSTSGSYLPNFDPYDQPIYVEPPAPPIVNAPPPSLPPVLPPVGTPSAEAPGWLDVTGMSAVYNPETGSIRFEGLSNVHGIGILKTGDVGFNPSAAFPNGSFSVANDEEIGWLFLEGDIAGGGFDAGAIFTPGLTDELSSYYIGVSSIGSGKNVTPIPIVSTSGSYLPSFDPFATPSPNEPTAPIVEVPPSPPLATWPPIETPPAELPPTYELPPAAELPHESPPYDNLADIDNPSNDPLIDSQPIYVMPIDGDVVEIIQYPGGWIDLIDVTHLIDLQWARQIYWDGWGANLAIDLRLEASIGSEALLYTTSLSYDAADSTDIRVNNGLFPSLSWLAAPGEGQQHNLPEPAGATLLIAAMAILTIYGAQRRHGVAANGR